MDARFYQDQHSPAKSNAEAHQAEMAAKNNEESSHRLFHLNLDREPPDRPLRFITFGCQGSGKEAQRKVALLLNELCADAATRPDFILILGDNVYEWGANAANDPAFKKYFDDMYLDLPHVKNIPFFIIPGNHDENRQGAMKAKMVDESGIPRIMHQIAHSLMSDERFSAHEKEFLYQQTALDLHTLPSWNMLRRYYTLIADDVQIFCVDSNTYINEYLDLCTARKMLPANTDMDEWLKQAATTNQAAWLEYEMKEAQRANRKIILAQHHPLYTPGKRAYERAIHNDLGIYLNKTEINRLKVIFDMPAATEDTPFNICLTECYRRQNLTFNLTLTAHDHNICYYNNKNNGRDDYKICQIISGGGGGDLQDRYKFTEQQEMGCFLMQPGLTIINHTTNAENFEILIHTADHKHQLEFSTHTRQAIIHYQDENPEHEEIRKFLKVVESALNKYFKFLGCKQDESKGRFFSINISHGNKGAERAHQLWAYIKHPHPKPLAAIIHDVERMTAWDSSGSPTNHSLITILNKKMMQKYKKSMQNFAALHAIQFAKRAEHSHH